MKGLCRVGCAMVCAALMSPGVAGAQAPATPTAPPVTSGFDNGFFIQSGNGDYRFVFGLNVQTDGRFSLDDPTPIIDTFTVRKARPTFSGRLTKYFEFKLMPDFGNGTTVLQDAYFDTVFSKAFRVRIGKDKTPFGYEWLIGDANVYFPERSLATSLSPFRDVGIQAAGELANGKVIYSGGLFNGVPDAASSTTDADTNNDKDLAGRILAQPWRGGSSALSGLGVHVGATVGDQSGLLPTFRTSVGQGYYSYGIGAAASGRRTRITPAAFYFYKSFGTFGEYLRSTQTVSRNGLTDDIANHAVNVTMAMFLTGEPAGIGMTRPKQTFDPASGHWGALQLLTRYSHLEVDGNAFVDGFAALGASRIADQWTGGMNWYPTAFTRWYLSYERTTFDKGALGSRPVENVILFRAQVAF